MPLPAPRLRQAGRCKAPEILRSEAYIGCSLQQACPVLDTGKDEGNAALGGYFSSLLGKAM
jgi:hypothetical protein